jgi:hypothetical protein
MAVKKPVFADAGKACPWGIVAKVKADALKFYGYDTQICWVCWSNFGPREIGDIPNHRTLRYNRFGFVSQSQPKRSTDLLLQP